MTKQDKESMPTRRVGSAEAGEGKGALTLLSFKYVEPFFSPEIIVFTHRMEIK